MRILTTSDLSYVGGGDSWGGTPEGQASYASTYPNGDGGSNYGGSSGVQYAAAFAICMLAYAGRGYSYEQIQSCAISMSGGDH